jgi:hypothetical protein
MPGTRKGWFRIAFAAVIIAAAGAIIPAIWRSMHPTVIHLNGRDYNHGRSCPRRFPGRLIAYAATGAPSGDVVKILASEPRVTPAFV